MDKYKIEAVGAVFCAAGLAVFVFVLLFFGSAVLAATADAVLFAVYFLFFCKKG